ncbi:TlpA disulfide reductase family protein [Roseisolibacter sp. H3M3-2]|uniref:TlpA family protein disulfide reductase n=1 Tax=Roseisolibacter sp. H3M3-2 TaxID=3031323 RepID=UPI0023DB2349|nr:TlpA disulfide reductase family protein [Roseisolibacter sp. H3M3-2]MDF1502267.1 TlpA disulfide reductase family protein [Roseisolibacter sp. H3M3-2]
MLRLLAAALLFAAPLGAQELGLPVGTKAPPAAVQTLDGTATDLARYYGRTPVLLEFWATWCPNCKQLEPQLQRIAREHGAKVKLVGVAVTVNQSPQRVRLYAQKYKLPMEMLWDAQGKASDAYDAPATSYVVLVDRAGKVVYTGQGGDQDLVGAVRRVLAAPAPAPAR